MCTIIVATNSNCLLNLVYTLPGNCAHASSYDPQYIHILLLHLHNYNNTGKYNSLHLVDLSSVKLAGLGIH